MTPPTPMLVVCALDAGCPTRDGTLQPKGTAVDRVVTNPDGSDYNPGPGYALVPDDGNTPVYVQNSGGSGPPPVKMLPSYTNDSAARAGGLTDRDYYSNLSGVHQVQASSGS